MRIISQNGMNDYPYEQCMIFVNYKERTKLCIAMCGDYNGDNDKKIVVMAPTAQDATKHVPQGYVVANISRLFE